MKTIKDIAKLSGYSIGTVSRVINDHPDVSEEAREKILRIIKKEGYQPNTNARHLKQIKASAITVFVKGSNNVFLNSVLEKIQGYLRSHHEEAHVVFLTESGNEVADALQICKERRPKGIIFLGGDLHNFREQFKSITVPAVLASGSAADMGFDNLSSFCTDDYEGGKAAAELLIQNGHRNIAVIGGFISEEKKQVSTNRLQGVIDAMSAHGIPFDLDTGYYQCPFSIRDGYEKTMELLSKRRDITAVFAISDMLAVGALRAIRDSGYRVPEDISLIGYDGIDYTRYTVPRIATICQDTDQLAKMSVEDLLFRISYEKEAVHRYIDFKVIDKESIGRIG